MMKSRIKKLYCRFQQFLEVIHTLTVEGFPEAGPLMHLSNLVFRSQEFEKFSSYEAHFFLKCSKVNGD